MEQCQYSDGPTGPLISYLIAPHKQLPVSMLIPPVRRSRDPVGAEAADLASIPSDRVRRYLSVRLCRPSHEALARDQQRQAVAHNAWAATRGGMRPKVCVAEGHMEADVDRTRCTSGDFRGQSAVNSTLLRRPHL